MDRIYVMELVRSFQVGMIGRREFVKKASLAIGSAAAATALLTACGKQGRDENPDPVVDEGKDSLALTDEDKEDGLLTGIVSYPHIENSTQILSGYLAQPEKRSPLPGVIVVQEWWGVDSHIKDVVRRFAREGFAALAPDLYHGKVATEPDTARKLVMELDAPNAVSEIQSAMTVLLAQKSLKGPKIGLMGFCMGGGLVLKTSLADERVGAAIPFYGSPLSPDQAAKIKAPVLGIYAAQDQGIPVARVRAMEEAIATAGVPNKFKIYENAGHAFFNDSRPGGYNAEAAKDAWREVLEWLKKYLK